MVLMLLNQRGIQLPTPNMGIKHKLVGKGKGLKMFHHLGEWETPGSRLFLHRQAPHPQTRNNVNDRNRNHVK